MKIEKRHINSGRLKKGDWLILPSTATVFEIIEVEKKNYVYADIDKLDDEDEWEWTGNSSNPEFGHGIYWQVVEATPEERETIKQTCSAYFEAYKNTYPEKPTGISIDWLLGGD